MGSSSSTTRKNKAPLKIMISGAPASGKGTQCELITTKVSHYFTFMIDMQIHKTTLSGRMGDCG